jgi:predicted RNA binding protein with dsRBD fold (UPF0201 family)
MDEVSVFVEVKINPTESTDKVKKAIENIFGIVRVKVQSTYNADLLMAEARGLQALTKLHNLLRIERIRDAARRVFFEGLDEKTITFCLNKQVAFAGHISFSKEVAESPLGPIKVKIKCDNPRELVDWLVQKTIQDDKK